MNDAELSVGIEDNLTPVLSKMVGQVRAFGGAINAESKQIDKSVRQVTKSMADLAGSGSTAIPQKTALSALTAQLKKEQAEMERLAHAANTRTTSSGRQQSVATGRLVSQADIEAYKQAAAAADRYEERVKALSSTLTNSTSKYAGATGFRKQQAEAFTVPSEVFNRAARDRDKLQGIYEQMWGGGWKRQARDMWPPEMLKGPEQFIAAMEKMPNSTRYALYDVANTATIAGVALGAVGVGAVVVAAQFERSFADVQRTVQGTPETLEKIRGSLLSLSSDAPVAFGELAQIASVGGQMGIAAAGIVNYTETIAKLTATTNLTADAASVALGRFKAFFSEASDPSLAVTDATFENLASSILKVGVNSVATETGIVNVSTQISSMGSYAGFTANQVIGLAGSLSSIGVPPELSRGVITRLFNNIGEAASNGGSRLQGFADLAGMSAEAFSNSWQTEDFASTFTKLISGLGEVARGGGDAVGALHDLGITSVRDVPVLLRLASAAGEAGTAGSLLAQTMGDAEAGWRDNTELAAQYAIVANTLVERLKVLGNNFQNLFAAIGSAGVGPAKTLVELLISITKGLTDMASTPAGQAVGGLVISFGLLTGALLLTVAAGARFGAFTQSAITGLSAIGIQASIATPLVRGLGIALAGMSVVGVVLAVAGAFVGMANDAADASAAVQNAAGALEALRADTASGKSGFMQLTAQTADMKKEMSDAERVGGTMSKVLDDVGGSGQIAAKGVEAATQASFEFGEASKNFIKDAILADQALQDFMKGGDAAYSGTTGFDAFVNDSRYSMDKLIELYATGGREAAESYLENISGIETYSKWNVAFTDLTSAQRETALAQNELLDATGRQVDGMVKVGTEALVAGEKMVTLAEGTNYAKEVTEEFAIANEDALKKAGEAMAKFVDPAKLIKFTQDFSAANQMTGDGAKEAADKAAKAWDDYYGGNSFKLGEYLNVFRGAAQIQEDHLARLDQLAQSNKLSDAIIQDLRELGPSAVPLVQALVNGTDKQLDEYKRLYGQTGFDAMVSLAASQLQAQTIVRNAARSLGTAEMNEFTEALRAGTPLTDALKKWQLDANGQKLTVPSETSMNTNAERNKIRNGIGPINIPVTPYLTQNSLTVSVTGRGGTRLDRPYANGGYTGRGSKWTPAGIVHAGEVVTPQKDVDQRTGQIKPEALIRMLNGSRPARHSGANGYANGGFVQSSFGGVVELGAATIQAIARSIDPRVFLDGADLSRSVHNSDAAQQFFGEG